MEGLKPARVVAPGTILSREVEARGWMQKDLARIIGRPQPPINEIVRGVKQITPATALELSEAFGATAEFWMNLETNYRLHLAEQKKKDKKIARKSKLYSIAPVSEMITRGWIKAGWSFEDLEEKILAFLGISSVDECDRLVATLRPSTFHEPESFAVAAWIKRSEHLANTQPVSEFEPTKLELALPQILRLSADANEVEKIPALLLSLGVRFVIVPHLPRTRIDGAMIPGPNPIIALTLRDDRLDNFWFTLMHEIAHVLAGHNTTRIDEEGFEAETSDSLEVEANSMARDWLIDSLDYLRFVKIQSPDFSRSSIAELALSQRRHPSIVLGRLQRDGEVDHKRLRGWHVKVTDFLKDWIDKPCPRAVRRMI